MTTCLTSPFASRVGTNYAPTDEEVIAIRGLLVEPLSRLKRLDEQVADLQKAIDKLTEERVQLSTYVDAHKAILSPVRRLPFDLMQEIFMACIPTHRNCVMSAVEAPVLLGRVCSAWRTMSQSTPRLWARLHIVEPVRFEVMPGPNSDAFEEKLVQRLETAKTWLGRSGQCPLFISLEGSQDLPPPPGSMGTEPTTVFPSTHLFLQALIPFAARWKNISLSVLWSALQTMSGLTEKDVPMLTKLEISQRPEPDPPTIPWPSLAMFRAPALRDFAFAGHDSNIMDFPIHWANLTSLSLMGHGWGVLTCKIALDVLSKCSQMQTCRLLLSEDNFGTPSLAAGSGSILELPHLHSLYLTSLGLPLGVGNLLSRLCLPVLRELELRGHANIGVDDPTFAANLVAFLAASSRFESLRADTQMFTKPSLIDLFRGLPATITRLHLIDRAHPWGPPGVNAVLDDDAIEVLTPSPDRTSAIVCPKLQELHITRCLCPSDKALLRFIVERMSIPTPALKRVEIQFTRQMQVDITADIQPFLDTAMLKVLTTYHHPTIGGGSFSPWLGLADAPNSGLGPWAGFDD
ncbi:hypothetical protein C8F04DRAFT_1139081 [Mycena alexandri]|uniref:F-box domain-containing protein n=1 Tax=Mycena alexandri TaxID=1745969 RepID=A0AAD6S7N6_9AGAR|nr:hypothetical protein C8F04DRAFT_1139081 [Mycena alexandri]